MQIRIHETVTSAIALFLLVCTQTASSSVEATWMTTIV